MARMFLTLIEETNSLRITSDEIKHITTTCCDNFVIIKTCYIKSL